MNNRKSICLAAFIAGTAVVCAWLASRGETRMVVEKMFTTLAMPYGMAWAVATLLLVVAAIRRERVFAVGLTILWCLIYFGGNGYLGRVLLQRLEQPYVHFPEPSLHFAVAAETPFDTVIVLGGGTSVRPDGSVQVAQGGDRVVTAARMYHAGETQRIICTGTLITSIDRFGMGQAEIAQKLLESLGVPPDHIERVAGRTTAEEMEMLAARFDDDSRVGLITSAWHLPRAERLANRKGFFPVPIPSDFGSTPDMRPTIRDMLPSAQAAESVSRVMKEWLATSVGR